MENRVYINNNFVSGVQKYEKIVITVKDCGAFCVIINDKKGNIQRQAYVEDTIASRVYDGQASKARSYSIDELVANPSIVDVSGYSADELKRLETASRYILNSFRRFRSICEGKGKSTSDFMEVSHKLLDVRMVLGNAFSGASTVAESKPVVTPVATPVVTPVAVVVENANAEPVDTPVKVSRKMATAIKMFNAEYLYGFTNGNYYELTKDDGEYYTLVNDFGIKCKVNKSRGKEVRVFTEAPIEE